MGKRRRWICDICGTTLSTNTGRPDMKERGFELIEPEVDEACTLVGRKDDLSWIFTPIEVSSRLWPCSVVGRWSCYNTERILEDVPRRIWFTQPPLNNGVGFKYYTRVVIRLFRQAWVSGQVIKTRKNDGMSKEERTRVFGSEARLVEVLLRSEDSEKYSTSFVGRLNLTIREACAYLPRRALSHART